VADAGDLRPVVLHTSWRGRLKAIGAPAILLALAAAGLISGGFGPVSVGSLVVGVVLAVIVIADYPLQVVFGADGIERRCLARRERLPWKEVTAIIRPAYYSPLRRWRKPSTGLIAQIGKRRYLLTDRMESEHEHAALLRGLGTWDRGLPVEATKPPDDSAPTWLHKRRRGDGGGLVDHL
jgi:hypothetical protein